MLLPDAEKKQPAQVIIKKAALRKKLKHAVHKLTIRPAKGKYYKSMINKLEYTQQPCALIERKRTSKIKPKALK